MAFTKEKTGEHDITINKIGGAGMSTLDVVEKLVRSLLENGEQPIFVVSAFKGVTNALLKAIDDLDGKDFDAPSIDEAFRPAKEIISTVIGAHFKDDAFRAQAQSFVEQKFAYVKDELLAHKLTTKKLGQSNATYAIRDKVIGIGEGTAVGVLECFLLSKNISAKGVHAVKSSPVNGHNGSAMPNNRAIHRGIQEGLAESFSKLSAEDRGKIIIFGGHVEGTPRGISEDVGRSYSDTTAVDLLKALLSTRLKIKALVTLWKEDVPGLLSGNPKELNPKKNKHKLITHVSYSEALELASAGSMLLQVEALLLALQHDIRLRIKQITDTEGQGTSYDSTEIVTGAPFKAVCTQQCDLITFSCPDMVSQSGFLEKLSAAFTEHHINVADPLSAGAKISFSIPLPGDKSALNKLRQSLQEICEEFKVVDINGESYSMQIDWLQGTYGNVSVIGNELKNQSGILSEITGVLAAYNINVEGVTHETSQGKISFYVHERLRVRAVQKLHAYFIDRNSKVRKKVLRRRAKISARYK